MKNKSFIHLLFISVLSISFFGSCKKESGTLKILLTDAPGNYQEVNVEILKVEVHIEANNDNKAGWYELQTNSGVYDLLKLQNTSTVLAEGEKFPVGKITQIRLILGSNNTLKKDNQIYSLTVPSDSETGIKISGRELKKNENEDITIDFDANLSVKDTGSGKYNLVPVISLK